MIKDTDVKLLNDMLQEINAVYVSTNVAKDKWKKIADIIAGYHSEIFRIYKLLSKQDNLRDIPLDYGDHKGTMKNITLENDSLRKVSFIISAIHNIIYDIMTDSDNHLFMLDGNEQMAVLPEDIKYYITINEKNEQNIQFHAFIILFGLESLFIDHMYVGIDFEFTDNQIRLAQLNFEHHKDNRSMIIIISPSTLSEVESEHFIELIMCNKNIKKILHGSDSKDTPYIYEELLDDNPDRIIEFTQALIDTKLLCDYYKLNRPDITDNRCSIYSEDPDSSAVYYFGVVSKDQQDKLTHVLDKMPVDITWNIHKLTQAQKLYAQYDVIFLKYFFYRIIHLACQNEDNDKKNTITIYRNIIPELTQYTYLESKEITYLTNRCKEEVDPLNNYFFKKAGKIVKMIDVFNQLSVGLVYQKYNLAIDSLLRVGYFKKKIQVILKRIIYGHLSRYCKIYQNKNVLWTDKLHNEFIIDFFKDVGLYHLADMFMDINEKLSMSVRTECRHN